MELLVNYLRKEVDELHENNVVINTIGDISKHLKFVKMNL